MGLKLWKYLEQRIKKHFDFVQNYVLLIKI